MTIEVKVPVLPESVTDAQMLDWHKKAGETVNRDENLVDIETDKVVLEVPAPGDGVLQSIIKDTGTTVHAEDVIAIIEPAATQPSAAPPTAAQSSNGDTPQPVDVNVPVLPESVTDAQMLAWSKQQGERVNRGENLVEIETDKVVLDVPSPVDGVLIKIERQEGETVHANERIAVIAPSAASAATTSATSAATTSESTQATVTNQQTDRAGDAKYGPAVARLLAEHRIDPSDVSGTGPGGRILKEDILSYFERQSEPAVAGNGEDTSAVTAESIAPAGVATPEGRGERRESMSRLRQTIAKRLVQSQAEAALLTTFNEVDLGEVMALRKRHRDAFEKRHGVRLGFMSFFAKACVEALQRYPAINAYIEGNDIVYHDYCDIGVAVSSPRGLVVPVLRNVEHMSFADIETAIASYGAKAKDGKLAMSDLTGGTFTISNGGVFGSLVSTPIINPPQSGILGMHKIQERPMAVAGEVVIRPMMYLALSYDHRIVDGREAVQFLVTIKEALEDPARLMLGV